MPEFPRICPDWVGDYKPPSKASATQEFQDKSRTAIRLSNISTAGEITLYYERLTHLQAEKIWAFWNEVETVESFDLPPRFFRNTSKQLDFRYRKISPTGKYRITEEPQETRLNNRLLAIEIRLRGEIE